MQSWMAGCSTTTTCATRWRTASLGLTLRHARHAALVLLHPSDRRAAQAEPPHRIRQAGHAARRPHALQHMAGDGAVARRPCCKERRRSWPCSTRRATLSCTWRWSMRAPIEMLQGMGKTVVSSADLVSEFEAVLTDRTRSRRTTSRRRRSTASSRTRWREMGARARGDRGTDRVRHGRVAAGGDRERGPDHRARAERQRRRQRCGFALRAARWPSPRKSSAAASSSSTSGAS